MDKSEVNINYNLLSADIMLPVDYFKEQKLKADNKTKENVPAISKGIFFVYDVLYSNINDYQKTKGKLNLTYFFSKSFLDNSFLLTYDETTKKIVRLDTTFRSDNIENATIFQVGDFIMKSNFFTNSIRAGGIQIGTNFKLKPDLITYPLPDFSGSAAVPTSIDVYYENTKILTKDLTPGPFEIKDLPVLSPEGNLKIVIKDSLGRYKVVNIPFITHPKLLREDLSEYAISFGAIRKSYQVKDFDYGRFFTNFYYKRGLTNRLTLETGLYAEGKKGFSAGLSPYILLGKLGLITLQFATSYNSEASKTSKQLGFSYNKSFKYLNLGVQYKKYDRNFLKPNSVLGNIAESLSLLSGFRLPIIGGISLSYTERKYFDSSYYKGRTKSLNVSYTKKLWRDVFFSLSYNTLKSSNEPATYSIRGNLTFPLGDNLNTSLQVQKRSSQSSYKASISNKKTADNRLTYKLSINKADTMSKAEGNFYYYTNFFNTYIGTSYTKYETNTYDNPLSYRAGLSGSVIYMDNQFFLRRKIERSFALVRITPPIKNARVLVNNRPVGETDSKGIVLIPYLSPYRPNEVKVDPASLDLKTYIPVNISSFIPYEKHGYIINFESKKLNSVRLKIMLPDGSFPEPGSQIILDGKSSGIVGYNGKAFIEKITPGRHLITLDYYGEECTVEINIDDSILDKIAPFIGKFTCKAKNVPVIAKKTRTTNPKQIQTKIDKELQNSERKTNVLKEKSISKKGNIQKKEKVVGKFKEIEINYDDFDEFEEFLDFREQLNQSF